MTTGHSQYVLNEHIQELLTKVFLSGAVLDLFFWAFNEREKWRLTLPGQRQRSYFFTTQFKLSMIKNDLHYCYDAASIFTRGIDIFSYDQLFFPCHVPLHWICVVVYPKKKIIKCYDSLIGTRRFEACLLMFVWFLADEHNAKKKSVLPGKWKLEFADTATSPSQGNGYDCGVFVCMVADCLLLGLHLDCNQTYADTHRTLMAYRAVNKRIDNALITHKIIRGH